MSIKTQITRIENAKEDILSAIASQGVTIPNDVLLDEVADLIRGISENRYLLSEADSGSVSNLSVLLDGETGNGTSSDCYLSMIFN